MGEVLVAVVPGARRPTSADGGYLLGGRPCLADFAVFGANAAHFVGDPYCRELADEHGPAAVAHTHRLQIPQHQTFGDWFDADDLPRVADRRDRPGRSALPPLGGRGDRRRVGHGRPRPTGSPPRSPRRRSSTTPAA